MGEVVEPKSESVNAVLHAVAVQIVAEWEIELDDAAAAAAAESVVEAGPGLLEASGVD